MKKKLKYSLIILGLMMTVPLLAKSRYEEKTREIHKHYTGVSKSTLLYVSNQFGKIHIQNWDKNEVDVKVQIVARGNSEAQASRLLSKVEIDISQSSNELAFITKLNFGGQNSESIEVNYIIYMNPQNPVVLENKFGDIYLSHRNGSSEIELSYGSLKSQGATGAFELELSFGDAEIGALQDAEMEINYSEVFLASAQTLVLEQKFSEVEIENVADLKLEVKYGELKVGKVARSVMEGHFSSIDIGELSGQLELEGNYLSNFYIRELRKTFSQLELSGQFSRYRVALEPGLSADILAEFSYADMDYSGLGIDFYYKSVEDNTKEYKGRINGGHPDKKIIVSSSYGNLKIN